MTTAFAPHFPRGLDFLFRERKGAKFSQQLLCTASFPIARPKIAPSCAALSEAASQNKCSTAPMRRSPQLCGQSLNPFSASAQLPFSRECTSGERQWHSTESATPHAYPELRPCSPECRPWPLPETPIAESAYRTVFGRAPRQPIRLLSTSAPDQAISKICSAAPAQPPEPDRSSGLGRFRLHSTGVTASKRLCRTLPPRRTESAFAIPGDVREHENSRSHRLRLPETHRGLAAPRVRRHAHLWSRAAAAHHAGGIHKRSSPATKQNPTPASRGPALLPRSSACRRS